MKTPKITVKNVKTFEGHDGIGVNADVYVNGVYLGHALDEAHGGELDFHYDYGNAKAKELFAELEEYVKTLPERTYGTGDRSFSMKVTVYDLINDAINDAIALREEKKRQKQYEKVVAFGVPDAPSYRILKMPAKMTVAEFIARPENKMSLQLRINEIKKRMGKDEVILNADHLRSLGLTV